MSLRLPAHALRWSAMPMLGLVLLVAACTKQGEEAPAGADDVAAAPAAPALLGTRNRNGSQLAYAHEVRVRLAPARIAPSLAATRDACMAQRFGDCTLVGEELGAGEDPTGLLRMRAAPDAIGGLVGIASAQGEIAQRSTEAEDLADAVRDNGLRRARLELQHRKLGEILERRDLKPVDLFAITERMAELEAQLQAAEQEAAQQQRRIQTNLLTIHFQTSGVTVGSSRIAEALRGVTSTWDASIGVLISVVAALLPFALMAGLVIVLVRWARRRAAPRPSSST